MKRFAAALLSGTVLLAAIPASGQRLCVDIASRLRADRAFTAAGSHVRPLDALAKRSFVEVATSSHEQDAEQSQEAYVRSLAAEYGMDETLAGAIKETADFERNEVWSLKAGPVHAFTNMAGTAHCATFVFFADGHRLPDPPKSLYGGMTEDAESMIECYTSEGNLARMGGKIVFAVTDSDMPRSFDVDLRIAVLDGAGWSDACRVDAKFETLYRAKQVFRPGDGPLSRDEITRAAPRIAHARDRARAAKKTFAYGGPLPEGERKRLLLLSEAHHAGVADNIPTFGAKVDHDVYEDIGNDRDDLPVAIKGKSYLVRIAHPSIGWRDFGGYRLIFYRAEGDTLVPVASAIVDEDRGKLATIKAVALEL